MAVLDDNDPLVDPVIENFLNRLGHGRCPFSRADDDDPPEALQIILDAAAESMSPDTNR
jgi:hypothetical protein